MKKLKRLEINTERLLKKEDLLIIKGGEYENACTCMCYESNAGENIPLGYLGAPDGKCGYWCLEYHGYDHISGMCVYW